MAGQPKCLVCAKACEPSDRNVDGTYAHRECLYATMTKIIPKIPR